jgi:hypothetical protein
VFVSGEPSKVTITIQGNHVPFVTVPEIRKLLCDSRSIGGLVVLAAFKEEQAPTLSCHGVFNLFAPLQLF